MVVGTIIGLLFLASVIWVIYDVWAKQPSKSTGMKVVWTICALLFGILTAIVYFFFGRK